MTPYVSTRARLALVLLVPLWLAAEPAAAQRRNPNSGGRSDTPRESGSAAAPSPAPRAVPRAEPRPSPRESQSDDDDRESARPTAPLRTADDRATVTRSGGRDRGGKPVIGEAVPRTEPPPTDDRPIIVSDGYRRYPYAYVGYPYGYGGYGYGGYGGYGYGGYYDPYGGYAQYPLFYDEGKLRLKIKPTAAVVYVDGYYVGIVDDFDGIFQRLRLEAGYHRIEIQEPGFEPLVVDVRIEPGRTTTYRGSLRRTP